MSSEVLVEALLKTLLEQSVDETTWGEACEVAEIPFDEDLENPVDAVHTFEEQMVLTGNRGLVVRLHDGSEFQVTIVRSRPPRDGD